MPPDPPRTAAVSVVRGLSNDRPEALLAQALADPEIHRTITSPARSRGQTPAEPRALVVVAVSPPAPVAAAVVHELVDLLYERGWDQVDVGAALTVLDRDRGHHQLVQVAREAGLVGLTRARRPYRLIDLHDDLAPADVPEASVLSEHEVSRAWLDADLRILLSRNVTDPFDGFALGLALLLHVAPPVPGADRADVAADLHSHLPAHVSVIDATTSSHGEAGDLVLNPLATHTVIAGTDELAVDLAAAQLQGTDPISSRLVAAALDQSGSPATQRVDGDLTPYAGWQAAHPLLRAMAQDVDGSPGLARILALLMTDGELPDPVLTALRTVLGPVMSERADPAVRSWIAGAGYTLADTAGLARAWQMVLAKDAVQRVEKPLGFDPSTYPASAFDELPDFLSQFESMLDGLPPSDGGLRWRTVAGATVFEVSRTVPATYADWVARVDVSRGISLMSDYLGGRVVVLTRDRQRRPRRQAERNVYLPQPNYLALWGGRPIDVAKIELVEYADDWCRLSWRTVLSPNGSATYDDGSLTFAADGEQTRLTVLGRQLFTLPPYWQSVDLTRFPEVRDRLVEDAYQRFFATTFDNLEACFEGRDFRVGRPPGDPDGPLPTTALTALLDLAKTWLADRSGSGDNVWGRATSAAAAQESGQLDADGFRHFPGPGAR